MNKTGAIYTEETVCQDCYKCIRQCPVKAISVEDGHAVIMADNCILCGVCVNACPVGAKKVRDDSSLIEAMLDSGERVCAAVAPSLLAMDSARLISPLFPMLERLGFSAWARVSDGADWVNARTPSAAAAETGTDVLVSSACPAANRYLRLYGREEAQLVNLPTPMLAACAGLKQDYDRVVFIGPCAAKKWEGDSFPQWVDGVLTLDELESLMNRRGFAADAGSSYQTAAGAEPVRSKAAVPEIVPPEAVRPETVRPETSPRAVPYPATVPVEENPGLSAARLYPKPGGMLESLSKTCRLPQGSIAVSGVDRFQESLDEAVLLGKDGGPVFMEMLSCRGGCLEGQCASSRAGQLRSSWELERFSADSRPTDGSSWMSAHEIDFSCLRELEEFSWPQLDRPVNLPMHPSGGDPETDLKIRNFLDSIGKHGPKDEKDCGACGYDSCRDFAWAVVNGFGERNMCVSNLRMVAERKANALLKTMPCAVVIVDDQLGIVECNRKFLQNFLPQAAELSARELQKHIHQVNLERIIEDCSGFRQVLKSGATLEGITLKKNERIYELTIFPVEKERTAGCLLQDITQPFVRRESVIRRAKTVLEKNVQTVQQIAFLLGENASESEQMLRAVIESFGGGERDE